MTRWPALAAVFFCLAAVPAQASDITGQWARGDGVARVKIAPCSGAICITNTWIKPGSGNERAGDYLVLHLKDNSGSTLKGTAFDPQRNLTFDVTMNVSNNHMSTRGCMLAGVVCKNVEWTRLH